MSKGIASKNSLKALAYPVQQFIAGWGSDAKSIKATPSAKNTQTSTELPAIYELAALRGEAVLRTRFFGELMTKIPVSLSAGQQIAL